MLCDIHDIANLVLNLFFSKECVVIILMEHLNTEESI